jgi:hypothetical protein
MIMMIKTKVYTVKSKKVYPRGQIREYLRTIGEITAEERKELLTWLAAGNSINDSPFTLYDGDGRPMDFINGLRTGLDMQQNPADYVFGSLDENWKPGECTDF